MQTIWTKDLETGVYKIDEQHKTILQKLNEFHLACEKGRGEKAIGDLIKFLQRYVKEHFILEEAYMFVSDYPKLEAHKKEHDLIRKELDRQNLVSFECGNSVAEVIRANFLLAGWWRKHILKVDKSMVKFLNKKHPGQDWWGRAT